MITINDGDLDLFIANGDAHFMTGMPPLLLENVGAGRFEDAHAEGGPLFQVPINARGSGACGLGSNAMVDVIEVRWPGGQTQSLTNVPADRVLRIIEPGESRWGRRS